MARRMSALLVCLGLIALVVPGVAAADTGDIIEPQNETSGQGFQAGTCTVNEEGGKPCSPETPNLFFKTAAGHTPIGFTQYFIQHEPFEPLPSPPFPPGSVKAEIKGDLLDHTIKTLRVDLPPGLTVNPEATPSRCPLAQFLNKVGENFVPACDPETKVGEELVTLTTNKAGVEVPGVGVIPIAGFVIPPTEGATKVPVYNLVPAPGEPAKFGFVINAAVPVFLETEVAWENDFHESFTIKLPNSAEASGLSTLISRLVNFGDEATGNGTYITNPTTCFDPNNPAYARLYSTWFRAESYGEPNPNFPQGSTPFEAKLPKEESGQRVMQEDCDTVPFEPSIGVTPTTTAVDSPTGGTVETKLPFDPAKEGGTNQSQSHLRSAKVTLPAGMGLNPSAANGLQACTDAAFRKGVRLYNNACPAGSVIGSAEIESPPLAEPLKGAIYVGEQKSLDPTSGQMFRILVEAKSENEGIAVRLVGNVVANPTTGQLTAVFNEQQTGEFTGPLPDGLPQVPFESVKLNLDAAKTVLTTPPTCTTAETTGQMEPWARPGTTVPVVSKFTLTSVPGGGTCPTTLAARAFTPTYEAVPNRTKAGGYSPLIVDIRRFVGQQELKGVDVTLPKGLTGKLAGIEYCPEAELAAAAASPGTAGLPCGDKSYVGTAYTALGTGPAPISVPGNVYLAGPYKGAPFSLAVVTPGIAGPFDLGTVVIRVAIEVNPRTAQVRAISDPIPDVFGGVKLDIRSINVRLNRKRFMLNPTNCQPASSDGTLSGGGANPANPAAFSAYPFEAPFRASDCGDLGFKPKLHTRLTGPTKRAKNPRIRAVLEARDGDANIERTALILPSSLFLDQSHIKDVCTRVQLAARECPKSAIYGQAKAKTPLLSGMLKGPVYLVSSNHTLPDLVADLRGQVNVRLYGVIGSKRGGLKTVFYNVPDVPVNKFILNMKGGDKSLLVNSTDICKDKEPAFLNMRAHNSRIHKVKRYQLNRASC